MPPPQSIAAAPTSTRSSNDSAYCSCYAIAIVAVGCGGRPRSRLSLSSRRSDGACWRGRGVVVAWEGGASILPVATGHHRRIPWTPKVRDFSGIWVTGGGVGMPRRCQKICLEQPPQTAAASVNHSIYHRPYTYVSTATGQ